MKASWTQPVCENRFFELTGYRIAHRLKIPKEEWEPCCFCGTPTNIYIRIDPKTVPFPRMEPE
jgi:hypothetical protein